MNNKHAPFKTNVYTLFFYFFTQSSIYIIKSTFVKRHYNLRIILRIYSHVQVRRVVLN